MTAVRASRDDDLLVVAFTRPILTRAVLAATRAILARTDDAVRAVVLESAHPSIFLAGAHLGEIAGLDTIGSAAYAEEGRSLMDAVSTSGVPVVAAVHGVCAGGGLDLALSCDWIVASPDAALGHPGIRRGLITGWGGTAALAARLSPAAMLGLIASGDTLPASRARALGLVDEIAPDPRSAARRTARRLAGLHAGRIRLWRSARSGGFVDRFGVRVVHTRG